MERKTVRIQRHFFHDWHDAEGCTPTGAFIVTSAEEDDADPMGVRFAHVDRGDIGIVGVLEIAGFNAKTGKRTVAALHIDGAQAEVLAGILKQSEARKGRSDAPRAATTTFVRHRFDPDALPRRHGPLASDHPIVGSACPACSQPIVENDFTALVPLGPGDGTEAREKARAGRPFNAVAAIVHYVCATGVELPLPNREAP